MWIGDATLDTIGMREQEALRDAIGKAMPHYAFQVCINRDGVSWVVLEPPTDDGVRFTLCRIAPCLLVMAESTGGRRRIVSTEGVEDAVAYASSTAADAPAPLLH